MLTRSIQRSDCVAQNPIEYEYEYRDAEYELESGAKPEPGGEPPMTRILCSTVLGTGRLPPYVRRRKRVHDHTATPPV
jgi:hypothetical protein